MSFFRHSFTLLISLLVVSGILLHQLSYAGFGDISTIAGTGVQGTDPDGSVATAMTFFGLHDVAVHPTTGDIYFSEQNNHKIRKIDATTQVVTTVIGDGTCGLSGEGGLAVNAVICSPAAIEFDPSGNLFISGIGNARILRIDGSTGIFTTYTHFIQALDISIDAAGDVYMANATTDTIQKLDVSGPTVTDVVGVPFSPGFSGDGGPATLAQLDQPFGLKYDRANDLLYLSDQANNRVRRIDMTSGIITTIAGDGNDCAVQTSSCGDGPDALLAQISYPWRMDFDGDGNLVIADYTNHKVRVLDLVTGALSTFAGNGTSTFSGDGGPAASAGMSHPSGIGYNPNTQELYITELLGYRIRAVDLQQTLGVLATTPEQYAVAVDEGSDVEIVFDASVNTGLFNSDDVVVNGSLSGVHSFTTSFSTTTVANDTLTINPDGFFIDGEEVTVSLSEDFESTGALTLENGYVFRFIVDIPEGDGQFSNPGTFVLESGADYTFPCLADFDGDRFVDVALPDFNGDAVDIRLNDGTGAYPSTSLNITDGGFNRPHSLACGDIDNDGDIDLVSTNFSGGNIFVLKNTSSIGSVSFAAPSFFTVASQLYHPALVDMNGDGFLDVIVSRQGSGSAPTGDDLLHIHFNDGTGGFSSSYQLTLGLPDSGIRGHTNGDFNGDGFMDLFTCNRINSGNSTCQTYLNDGTGMSYQTANFSFIISGTTEYMTSGDLDDDGDEDVVLSNSGSDFTVLLNDGSGTFARTDVSLPVFIGSCPVVQLADVDTDDDLDVVMSCSSRVSVAFNDGTGTFSSDIAVTSPTSGFGMDIADINNDGAVDVVKNSGFGEAIAIHLGSLLEMQIESVSPVQHEQNVSATAVISVDFDQPIDLSTVNSSTLPVWGAFRGLVSGSYAHGSDSSIVVFTPDESFLDGEQITFSVSETVRSPSGHFVVGGYHSSFWTVVSTAAEDFVTSSSAGAGSLPVSLDAADIDLDGDIDLVTSNFNGSSVTVSLNNGDGTFTSTTYAVQLQPYGVIFSDLDNDGYADLIATNSNPDTISVFMNAGDGTFPVRTDVGVGDFPYFLTSGDVNNDGWNDIVTANLIGDTVSVLLNDGTGSLLPHQEYPAVDPRGVTLGDFDQDGDLDIAQSRESTDGVYFLENNGDGGYAAPVAFSGAIGGYAIPVAGDFNGDLDLDLAYSTFGFPSTVKVSFGQAGLNFQSGILYFGLDNSRGTAFFDLDADGFQDIIATYLSSAFLTVFYNDGSGGFIGTRVDYPMPSSGHQHSVVADFTGDGIPDIASTNSSSSGQVTILRGVVNSAPVATVPTSITQATDGSGEVSFEVTVSDVDNDLTSMTVEYSDDGGSNYYDADITSVVADSGTVNGGVGQVGDVDAIDTVSGARTLTLTWETQSLSNGNGPITGEQSDIQLRVTPNDGTVDGTMQSTGSFAVDNQIPVGLTELIEVSSTQTEAELSWMAVTESNFSRYVLSYGENQSDVVNRTGAAEIWDETDDVNLNSIATTGTIITNLDPSTEYYIKVFAEDVFGNVETVLEILLQTIGSGGRRARADLFAINGSVSETPSEIIEDTTLQSEDEGVSSEDQEGGGDVHGSAELKPVLDDGHLAATLEQKQFALDQLSGLLSLFDWMEGGEYDVLPETQRRIDAFQLFFQLKNTLLTIGRGVHLTNGVMLRMPEYQRIIDVPQLAKMMVLSSSACFTEQDLTYADTYDIPGDPYWWVIYALLLEDVFDIYELLEVDVQEVQSIELLKRVVQNQCFQS